MSDDHAPLVTDGGVVSRLVERVTGTDRDAALGLDTALELLTNERRRAVVDLLGQDEDREWTTGDLAEGVVVMTHDDIDTIDEVPSDERKAAYVTLYQSHLPRLAAAGLINTDWDPIEPTPALDRLADLLDAIRDHPGVDA